MVGNNRRSPPVCLPATNRSPSRFRTPRVGSRLARCLQCEGSALVSHCKQPETPTRLGATPMFRSNKETVTYYRKLSYDPLGVSALPFRKPVDQLTEQDLQLLVDVQAQEGARLEYKREIDLTEKGKREVAKDVAAMANSQGGYIIYGIDEDREQSKGAGVPARLCPLQDESAPARLEQVLLTTIAPRPDFTYHRIPASNGYYLVVAVRQSLDRLHMVTFGDEWRYYKRREYSSVPMTWDEVQLAYERINRSGASLDERLERAKQPVPAGWRGIQLTVVPYVSWMRMLDPRVIPAGEFERLWEELEPQMRFDLRRFSLSFGYSADAFSDLQLPEDIFFGIRLGFDGSFTILYRFRFADHYLPVRTIDQLLHDFFLYFGHTYRRIGYNGRVRACLTIHGAQGTLFPSDVLLPSPEPNVFNRPELQIPLDTQVDSMVEAPADVALAFMDYLSHAYGMPRYSRPD